MDLQKIKSISATLYTYGVADFNKTLLQKISIQDLIEIIQSDYSYKAVFRASWALEHMLFQDMDLLTNYKQDIFKIYLHTNNWSALRSITKLILLILRTPDLSSVNEEKTGLLLDKSFHLIANQDCPIAVRCNLYDLIYVLANDDMWILQELQTQINFDLEKSATPALRSRASKIFKKLKRISKN